MDYKTLALYLGCDVKIGDRQGTLMQVGCNGEGNKRFNFGH